MEVPQPVPPRIPGYDFVRQLGAGSEATVYLYQQRSPARPVAIKVSNKSLDPRAAARFRAEADFMAQILPTCQQQAADNTKQTLNEFSAAFDAYR